MLLLLLLHLGELRHEQPKIDQLNRINTRRRLRLETENNSEGLRKSGGSGVYTVLAAVPGVCCEESTAELRTRATDVGGV